jgi:hypothetical protein
MTFAYGVSFPHPFEQVELDARIPKLVRPFRHSATESAISSIPVIPSPSYPSLSRIQLLHGGDAVVVRSTVSETTQRVPSPDELKELNRFVSELRSAPRVAQLDLAGA